MSASPDFNKNSPSDYNVEMQHIGAPTPHLDGQTFTQPHSTDASPHPYIEPHTPATNIQPQYLYQSPLVTAYSEVNRFYSQGAPIEQPGDPIDKVLYIDGQSSWPDGFPLDMSPANNCIDPVNYPKSTALYQGLVDRFGAQNIMPLPQFLADTPDKARCRWYKCDANAQLYFLYKTPKYKAEIQKLLNVGCCGNCCCYNPILQGLHKYQQSQTCSTCFEEAVWVIFPQTLLCYPLIHATLAEHYSKMYPATELDTNQIRQDLPGCCCSFGANTNFEYNFLHTLRKSGFNVTICPKFFLCCQVSWCTPCVAMRREAVISYYFAKRYGFRYNTVGPSLIRNHIQNTPDGTIKWEEYYNLSKSNPLLHVEKIYYRGRIQRDNELPHDFDLEPMQSQKARNRQQAKIQAYARRVSREVTKTANAPQYPAFQEWYDVDKVIEHHNTRWTGSHRIVGSITME